MEGVTVSLILYQNEMSIAKEVVITDATNGHCQFTINKIDIPKVGLYFYRVILSSPGKTFPSFKNQFQVVN